MNEEMNLTTAQARLEEILKIMNDKSASFEELLKYYEEASRLLIFCYAQINEKKGRLEQLSDRLNKAINNGDEDNAGN